MLYLRLQLSVLTVCGCALVASAQNRPEVQADRQRKPAVAIPQNSFTSGAPYMGAPAVQPATVPGVPRAASGQTRAAVAGTPRQLQPLRPPRVSYSNGMLSIVAENSTLADVLNAVRQKTGAAIEAPPSAASERVIISIGPAPANDVLTTLLNGSRFDYILLGAQHSAGRPVRLILREKQSTTQANAANPGVPGANGNPMPGTNAPVSQLPPEIPDEEQDIPETEVPEEVQPEPQPEQAPGQQLQQQQQQQQGQPQVKTPEQLLEELKQMQQQQQQQQGQPQQNEQTPPQPQQQPIQPPQQAPDNEPPPD